MKIKVWVGLVIGLLFLLSNATLAAPSDQDYASHVTVDLGLKVNIEPLHAPINATYKLIDSSEGMISWSFNKEGKGDTGFVYSDGRIFVGSQDKFDPKVKDKLDAELKAAIDLVNSTEPLTEKQRNATEGATVLSYYSGEAKVDAATWNRCGNTLVESGRYGPAMFYYDKSREADPSFADPWNNEGVALRNLGRYKEALVSYNEALNLSPNNSDILNNRGESQYHLKRLPQALDDFNRSCQLDPGGSQNWYNKGVVLSRKGRYIEALDCYSKSLESDSYNAYAWNNKGVALARLEMYQDALPCFSNAATINPKLAGTWANGGIVLKDLGLENKSQDAFSKARALGYNQTKTYYEAETLSPTILGDNGKTVPGFGITSAMILICLVRAINLKKKRTFSHAKIEVHDVKA